MKTLISALTNLVKIAEKLGLNPEDVKIANEYLFHNEYGLCFDTIVTQMYEYDIDIDLYFYELVVDIAITMKIEETIHIPLKELIKPKNN